MCVEEEGEEEEEGGGRWKKSKREWRNLKGFGVWFDSIESLKRVLLYRKKKQS